MKYKFRKALVVYKTDIDFLEERFGCLINRGINTFLTAMRVNGKRLTPKNYKITMKVLKELSNGEVIIEYIQPIKKHEKEYVGENTTYLTKGRMKINFSKEIKTLGSEEEIFRKVKEIIRGLKNVWKENNRTTNKRN